MGRKNNSLPVHKKPEEALVLGRLQTFAFDGLFESLFCLVYFRIYMYFLTLERKLWFFFFDEKVKRNTYYIFCHKNHTYFIGYYPI